MRGDPQLKSASLRYAATAGVTPAPVIAWRAFLRSCGYEPADGAHLAAIASSARRGTTFLLWVTRRSTGKLVLKKLSFVRKGGFKMGDPTEDEVREFRVIMIRRRATIAT